MSRSGFRLTTAAVLGFSAVGLGAAGAHAAGGGDTLFVNGAAGCSDTTADSSVQAYCTIGAAVAKVQPGQRVQIASGTYQEAVTVGVHGTSAAPVAIGAAPGAKVQIGSAGSTAKTGVLLDHASYVTLSGLKIFATAADDAVAVLNSSHISVLGVSTEHARDAGVRVTGSDATLVARSWLTEIGVGSAPNGVVVDGGSTGTVLAGNASSAYQRAVWIHGATGTVVTGTTNQYSCVAGLEVDSASTGTVAENNIFANSDSVIAGSDSVEACGTPTPDPNHGDIAVAADSEAGSHFDFNIVDSSLSQGANYRWGGQAFATAADFTTATGQGARDIVANPQLSTYDVPLEGSPAIDSADSGAAGEQNADMAGNARVVDPTLKQTGSGVRNYDDRGAFEFQDPFAVSASATETGFFTARITAATAGWQKAAKYTFDFGGGDVVTQSSPTITRTFAPRHEAGAQSFPFTVTAVEAGTGTTVASQSAASFAYGAPNVQVAVSTPLSADKKSYSLVVDASGTRAGSKPVASYTFTVTAQGTASPHSVSVTQASPVYTLDAVAAGMYSVTVTATDTFGVSGTMEVGAQVQSVTAPPPPGGASTVERVSGADRYLTATAVSQKMWADASGDRSGRKTADAVVLATGTGFADAVAGVPLAAKAGGPLLLTEPKTLTPATATEITRVLPAHRGKTVYVLGGAGAIDETVATKLRALGYDVVRFAGSDRYATALQIAQREFPTADHVVVATGRAFPDALAAGPLAAVDNAPIVLSDGSILDPATRAYLQPRAAAGDGHVIAVGGDADRALLDAAHGPAIRHLGLVGADRYSTAASVADRLSQQTQITQTGLATGEQFADALTGGAMMAELGQPLLLTPPTALSPLDAGRLDWWASLRTVTVTVFGGPAAVTESVVQQVRTELGKES